jgi:hypothetical protein
MLPADVGCGDAPLDELHPVTTMPTAITVTIGFTRGGATHRQYSSRTLRRRCSLSVQAVGFGSVRPDKRLEAEEGTRRPAGVVVPLALVGL